MRPEEINALIRLWLPIVLCTLVLGIAIHAAHAATEPHQSTPVVHITDDPGGNVAEYYRKYQAYSRAGAEVHFHGMCASACTFVLFTEFAGIKACADPGTIFGFHKPFQMKPDGKTIIRTKAAAKQSREVWDMQLESLPPGLRKYLRSVRVPSPTAGDETNTMLIIPAELLLPKCPMTVAAQ